LGSGLGNEETALAQFGAQGEHDVEHDADAGDALGRKVAAGLVGIDDAVGVGQRVAGRWWSVISVAMPCCWARATPSRLAMPLSTVMIRSGDCSAATSTISGDRP
jgi:hypothetical protein